MRQRWFGATRKQVPQLAVEGEIEFPTEPLVLDELDDARLRKLARPESGAASGASG